MEHRVQERTAELQQRNRGLETLLYVSSHDLREPLRSITNFSQLVRERYGNRLDAKGIDYIDRVIRAAQRMDQLMEDLLTLSRAQRVERPYEEVRGDDLVRAALTQLDETIRRTGARVKVADGFPSFRVNKTWVTQALYNLLANALKFHRPGEVPEIDLAPYRLIEEATPKVGLVVRNHGTGVVSEQLEIESLQAAVADAASIGYRVMSVSGGEPLLYPALAQLLRAAHAAGLVTTVTTNGMLLDRRQVDVLGADCDLVAISLDGIPESHNFMRNSSRSLDEMCARLPALRASGIPFGFIFTLTFHNVHELDWVARFAFERGASLLQLHPLEPIGRATCRLDESYPDGEENAAALCEAGRIRELYEDK